MIAASPVMFIPLEAVNLPVTVVTSVAAFPKVTAASKETACSNVAAAPANLSSSVPFSSYSMEASPPVPNLIVVSSGINKPLDAVRSELTVVTPSFAVMWFVITAPLEAVK